MKELIYKAIDILTGGKGLTKKVNGIPVKLPTRYINYFESDYERDNFRFMQAYCKPGSVVFDIGAHIGLFAVAAAKTVGASGKVFAFEPAPQTNALLNKTIAINKLGTVIEPRNEAMGGEEGSTVFYVSDIVGDNSNSLVSYKEDRPLHGIPITISTIDSFAAKRNIKQVDFIKIDVEGAEYDAIRGAANTLRAGKTAIILAIHPDAIQAKGDTLEAIYDFVSGYPYQVLYKGKAISKTDFCQNRELIDLHLVPRNL